VRIVGEKRKKVRDYILARNPKNETVVFSTFRPDFMDQWCLWSLLIIETFVDFQVTYKSKVLYIAKLFAKTGNIRNDRTVDKTISKIT